ncbi:MAG: lipocalin family protein [Saprospiraceae bacterium]
MRNSILSLLLLALFSLTACNTSDERLPILYGDWQGASWTRNGAPASMDPAQVEFSFNEDFTYTAKLGKQTEGGSFVFRESKLYTTATGNSKVEKVVGILKLEGDSLVFDMNRQGDPEKLVLLRK